MPDNGSGTYIRTDGTFTGATVWTQEKNAANLVTAAHFDTHDQDMASALSNRICVDGQTSNVISLNLTGTVNATTGVVNINGVNVLNAISPGGLSNMFVGASGNFTLTGTSNTGLGVGAFTPGVVPQTLVSLTSGSDNTALGGGNLGSCTTGTGNTAAGSQCLGSVTTGGENIGLGIGAGGSITTGTNNTCIGTAVDVPSGTANGQLNIKCAIFGTGLISSGSSLGAGKLGFFTPVPTYQIDFANVAAVSGGGFRVFEGSNAKQGSVALVAGTKTVSNTSVTANSRIFLTSNADGGTPGWLRVSARTAGTSFTITSSSGTDTSTVAYEIFEPY